MSSLQNHPDDGMLLRYLDGELPARKARQIRGHLEACWQCRTAAEEMQASIADCVRYRKNVLQQHLPAPPAAWSDLSREFAAIDAEVGVESWVARLRGLISAPLAAPPAFRWGLSAGAVMLVAAATYYQFHETPAVEAATLLNRAVVLAETHSAPRHAVRVRTRNRQFVLHSKAEVPEVAALFQAANYNFQDPLSARSFQEWRDSVAPRHDEVATVRALETPDRNCYRIHTTTEEGSLASASLMLRTSDLHPVEGRFEFRNREWVELTEFSDAPTTDGPTNTITPLEAPVRRAEPSRPAAIPPGSSALISEELRVMAALHGIGADLGDPVEIKRSDDGILVSGVGLPPRRRQDIQSALAALPNVSVQFAEPPQSTASDQPMDRPAEPIAPKHATLQARLEKQLGGRVELERFSSQMLDWMDAAMARAYALRALAQRFPAGTADRMPASDRALLNDLAREHTRFLITRMDDLHRTLAPVLASLGGAASLTAQGMPANNAGWQPEAEDVLRASRRVELLLSELMGVTPEPADTAQLPAELLNSLNDARTALANLQRGIQ
jgi:anti-sigma factor RsiW